MPIEGPLRELGIHDVFQLLDLSRKTGTLQVRSTLRDNEGTIFFGEGRVIYASIRSNPHPLGELLLRLGKVTEADLERAITMQRDKHQASRLGDILVEIGAISKRELERQMRYQVEEVVFELLSWNEGFFSFQEGGAPDFLPEVTVAISTESLLMEGARRIDEWSRIATRIPDLGLIGRLAEIPEERAPQLDLLPNEWEVLSMVDGSRSVRQVAHGLGRSDFEIARVLYGLVCTGIVVMDADLSDSDSGGAAGNGAFAVSDGAPGIIMHAGDAAFVRGGTAERNGERANAIEELQALLRGDPRSSQLHLELGFAQARAGMLGDAIASWRRCEELDPGGGAAARARNVLEHAGRLHAALEEHYNV